MGFSLNPELWLMPVDLTDGCDVNLNSAWHWDYVSCISAVRQREPHKRLLVLDEPGYSQVQGVDGWRRLAEILWKYREGLMPALNDSLKRVGLQEQLLFGDSGHGIRALLTRQGSLETKLSHVGSGVSQVLPVLAELLLCTSPLSHESRQRGFSGDWGFGDSLHVVEYPELHLHPRLHASLVDEFVSRLNEDLQPEPPCWSGPRFVFETHSEHILLRFLRHIRQGELAPEDLSIVVISQAASGEGSRVQNIRVDRQGRMLDPWPGGYFPERLTEVRS